MAVAPHSPSATGQHLVNIYSLLKVWKNDLAGLAAVKPCTVESMVHVAQSELYC